MGNEKLTEWKEFCSACRTYYTIKNGVWEVCPACDGLGKPNSNKIAAKDTDYINLRERWKLNAR